MLASSLCMYSVEHDAQPEVFRNAFSGVWWSMSTLLTVGYGDIYPITTLGRLMAICIAYLGVGVVAIPTGIISAGFVEQYQRKSSISNIRDADIKEIAEIFVDRRYAGKTVGEVQDEQQLTVFLILCVWFCAVCGTYVDSGKMRHPPYRLGCGDGDPHDRGSHFFVDYGVRRGGTGRHCGCVR